MIEKATLGIQEVNVGIISIVLVSVTSASVAATLMNAPIYMIIRQLSRDIKADEIALRQARRVRDIILLRNTTDLEKSEIEELLKDSQAESQNEDENNTGGGGKPGQGCKTKPKTSASGGVNCCHGFFGSGRNSPKRGTAYPPYSDPHKKSRAPKPCFFSRLPPMEHQNIRNASNWWPDFWRLAGKIWSGQSRQQLVYIPRPWGCAPK